MADIKNNQTGSIGLPEKEWFTLEEVADRWGCSIYDLLHYGITRKLRISVDFHEVILKLVEPIESFCDRGFQVGDEFFYEGLLILDPNDLRFIEKSKKPETKWLWAIHPVSQDVIDCGLDDDIMFSMAPIKVVHAQAIDLGDLLIAKQEIDRFEHEYRIVIYAGTMPSMTEETDRLDPRKEKTYLQIIRALLAAATMPDEPYKAADVLQTAAAAKGLVLPSKRDTIADKLKAARNLSD